MPAEEVTWQLTHVWMAIVVIFIVFIIFYLISWRIGWRGTEDIEDLWVAGRRMSAFVCGAGMASTWMSLATYLGVVALIYKLKMPFLYIWIQWILSIPLIVLLYGLFLRRAGKVTPPEFIRDRFGTPSSFICAGWMVLIMIMYALGQIIGFSKVFEVMLGLPIVPAILLGGLGVTGFVVIGGHIGVAYNDMTQMLFMIIFLIIPLTAILHALGSTGVYFPWYAYGDLSAPMTQALPGFFDVGGPSAWRTTEFFGVFLALTLGPLCLPHLAMRYFTADSLEVGRRSVLWFVFFVGLLFSLIYTISFAGVYHFQGLLGVEIPAQAMDKMTVLISLAYAPEPIVALLIAGILAAGISSISSHLVAIGAMISEDIAMRIKPDMSETNRTRMGYAWMGIGGIAATLLAFKPPAFLLVSILWAFALGASCLTPTLLLGTWSTRINRYGAITSMIVAGVLTFIISPHFVKSIVVGSQYPVAAAMGITGSWIAVPIGFILVIGVSLIAEKIPGLRKNIPLEENRRTVNEIHGWPADSGYYDDAKWLGVIAILSFIVLIGGLSVYVI